MSGIKIGHMVKLVPFPEVHMRYNTNPYDRGVVIKTNKNQMLDVLVGWRKEVKLFMKSKHAIDVFKELMGEDYEIKISDEEAQEFVVGLGDIGAFKKGE